jgi:uncharacterized protein
MEFEFDPAKSEANREKHGIDFTQSQELWKDECALEVKARSETEERFALIAQWNEKLWTCIFTMREGRIRIISTRRARSEEKDKYHNS